MRGCAWAGLCGTEPFFPWASGEAPWSRWHLSWVWDDGWTLNRGVGGSFCSLTRGQHGCGLWSGNRRSHRGSRGRGEQAGSQ